MALSALWQRCVSWSSAIAQLLQPLVSRGTSCPTGSANLGQQPGQKQQPLPAPSAPPAGTRTQLPPPAPLASSHGIAPPSGNARGCRKPLAPVPPVQDTQHGPTSSANPSGTPLGRGSPPDTSVPMDLDTTPALDISLGSDVPMDDDSPSGCDLSLASDVTMDEDSPSGRDLSLASDVTMDEDSPSGRDLSLASDVPMDGGSPSGSDHLVSCDISLSSDVPMDEDTFPRADISLPSHTTASHPGPLHGQAIGAHGVTPAGDTGLRRKVLPKRTRSRLHCSQGAVGTSRDDRSSVPMPTDHAGTSGTSPQPKNTSLCPPKKMPPTHRSVPKPSRAVLSPGHCNAGGNKPQDPQQGAGTGLPPPQSSVPPGNIALQRRGTKRKRGSGPSTGSKCKAPAARTGAGGC